MILKSVPSHWIAVPSKLRIPQQFFLMLLADDDWVSDQDALCVLSTLRIDSESYIRR